MREGGREDPEEWEGWRKAFATAIPLIALCTVRRGISSNLFHFKIELTNQAIAGLGRAIAAARPVTSVEMLEVNSDDSTDRAPDEVWFGR